ncbi:protealysin inhibitor emfourin [Nocardioides sp. cx-173]|uniref:protealysin inhibitor emfourin n=1 Tax=Nocardioides sp. cx-173 TaxID=2898796 RepID=UPI001E36C1EF|nr:protealysin inhibitor emfourin [Nocardioides sp. cx-173]MCD4526538.1 M4 family metallopeptidase [Nocardioides sp. cx-173]UGB41225.1 M4 family metallopeptidase [Nocardioides sp. cx-173]
MSRNHCFVPPYLLHRLIEARPDLGERWAAATLAEDERLRSQRLLRVGAPRPGEAAAGGPAWVVHTAGNETSLPGEVVRSAGEAASGDAAVDEAAAGAAGSLALFEEVYGRSSYDDAGARVSLTVHYGRDYANAFWDGTQLVFGDGDGEVFERFTKPVDVLAHEFTHAVTEYTAALEYEGQSGALNESVSDVFAACLKQRLLGQRPVEADWLIGEGLFLPGVQARGLRDMANPGTAYDDPALGRDPQPAHLDDYVETTEDYGGVHLNSGIPNRAFHLAALAIGGTSWEGAGRVWYAALTGGRVTARTGFGAFAAATVVAARGLGGDEQAEQVEGAWAEVGVTPAASEAAPGVPAPVGEPRRVRVRRGGGFAGRSTEAEVDLDGDDERAGELRDLVSRIDLAGLRASRPQPDRFVYDLDLAGSTARVLEQDLTDDLRRVVRLVLES